MKLLESVTSAGFSLDPLQTMQLIITNLIQPTKASCVVTTEVLCETEPSQIDFVLNMGNQHYHNRESCMRKVILAITRHFLWVVKLMWGMIQIFLNEQSVFKYIPDYFTGEKILVAF